MEEAINYMHRTMNNGLRALLGRGSLALILAVCLAVTLVQAASAHPPKSVSLSLQGSTLTVNVEHGVNDPAKHYVYRIIVYVDDKVVAQKEYTTQQSPQGLSDTFNIGSVAAGATVKAEAFCVIMGSTTGSITAR